MEQILIQKYIDNPFTCEKQKIQTQTVYALYKL